MMSVLHFLSLFHTAVALRMQREWSGQPRACPSKTMVQTIEGSNFGPSPQSISELCPADLHKKFTSKLKTVYKKNSQKKQESSLADCQIAYVTINNTEYPGHKIREHNIQEMLRFYPDMKVLHAPWFATDWEDMRKVFASLRVPICFWQSHWESGCDSKLTKGQVGRWLSLIMATAYLRASSHSCILLFEDDIRPFDVSRNHLKSVALPQNKPRILRFGQWGEALAINRMGAEEYHKQIFKHGIWMESDLFMNMLLPDVTERDDSVSIELLITPSDDKYGGIYKGERVKETDFDYDAADSSGTMMESLIQAFGDSDGTNHKLLRDMTNDFVGISKL